MAVIAVACTYQCADTTRIARGRGTDCPNARQAAVYRFLSSAFIGFPWPKNAAGMTVMTPPPVVPVIITPTPRQCEAVRRQPGAGVRRSAGGSHRAPAPSLAAMSPGLDSAHRSSDRQPHPMHEV